MKTQTQQPLSQVEVAVLQHVELYGFTVAEAVQVMDRRKSQREANRLLAALQKRGLLRAEILYGQRRCFTLTHNGRQESGGEAAYSRRIDKPLSEQARLRQFAMLSFCCLGHTLRRKLTAEELTRVSSDSHRSGLSSNYYTEGGSESARLGFLRVDTGGHGRWDRIVAKVRRDAFEHAENPAIDLLLQRGEFEVTVVTALPQKAGRLARVLQQGTEPLPVPVRVTAIPDLLYLIAPPPS